MLIKTIIKRKNWKKHKFNSYINGWSNYFVDNKKFNKQKYDINRITKNIKAKYSCKASIIGKIIKELFQKSNYISKFDMIFIN